MKKKYKVDECWEGEGRQSAVWPDFESSWLQFFPKVAQMFCDFLGSFEKHRFSRKITYGSVLGNIWNILSSFLFQHLVTLAVSIKNESRKTMEGEKMEIAAIKPQLLILTESNKYFFYLWLDKLDLSSANNWTGLLGSVTFRLANINSIARALRFGSR